MAHYSEQQSHEESAETPQEQFTEGTPNFIHTQDKQEQKNSPPSYMSPEYYKNMSETKISSKPASSGQTEPTQKAYHYYPSQAQYGISSNFGHGNHPLTHSTPPYFVPQQPIASPLPIGTAIRQLPSQYWRVLTQPSSNTFAQEMGKASWNIVWVQILLNIILTTVLDLLSNLLFPPSNALSSTDTSSLPASTVLVLQHLTTFVSYASVYGQVIIIPVLLFVGTGILFLLAKALGGTGSFLRELYCTLLFVVPLSLLINVLTIVFAFLSTAGSVLSLLVVIGYLGYEGVLLVLQLIPVHKFSASRATGAVMLYYLSAIVITCVLGFILAFIFTISAAA